MSKPVPAAVAIAAYAILISSTRPSSAVSSEAITVRNSAIEVRNRLERSRVLFGPKAEALSQLQELLVDHSVAGWDGDDAEPLKREAVQIAQDFVRALPDSFPLPEFAAEPDGAVSLDWIAARHRHFSISIDTTDRLACAWLNGTDSGHAVYRFDRQSVPMTILTGIRYVVGAIA